MPVPDSATATGLLEAPLVIEIEPLTVAAAEGVKTMLKVAFCPAAIVNGRLGPLREN
jgi:hypothetical protein